MHNNTCTAPKQQRIATPELQGLQQLQQRKIIVYSRSVGMQFIKNACDYYSHLYKKEFAICWVFYPSIICIKITPKPVNFKHQFNHLNFNISVIEGANYDEG